jgi:hypothetical protein
MKRLLLVLGPVLSIAGAVGLIAFGDAFVTILDGVLTYRIVDPPEPLPASFAEVKWAAFSGMALTLGLVISCIGMVIHDSQRTISVAGKILASVGGVLLVFGIMPLLWGILGAKGALTVIATSASAPKPEELQEMLQATAPMLLIGSAILLLGTVVLLVAGLVGLQPKSPPNSSQGSVTRVIVTLGCLLFGVVLSLLFFGVWLHGTALGEMFTDITLTPKPTEIAGHLMGIFYKSMFAFIGVGCLGIMHILAAVLAPAAESDAATNA